MIARKRLAAKAPPAATVVPTHKCAHCERKLPTSAFNPMPAMPGGLCPWCRECAAELDGGSAKLLRAYQRDYSREYARARRQREGPAYVLARVRVDGGRGSLKLRWQRSKGELKITGRWDLLEDAMRLLMRAFGAEARDVWERGRGGGRGSRRHKTFISTAPVSEEAWGHGVVVLKAAGMLRDKS